MREALIVSAPAALALVLLAAFGLDHRIGRAWRLAAEPGRRRLGRPRAAARAGGDRRLDRGPAARPGARPSLPEVEGALSGRLLRPVSELGRELRRQSGRMAAQQRMLRSVIEALPDPIMVVDQEMTVVQANAAASRSFEAPGAAGAAGPRPARPRCPRRRQRQRSPAPRPAACHSAPATIAPSSSAPGSSRSISAMAAAAP